MNDKMTSIYAKTSARQMNVVFIVYPDIVLLDLAGPLQVFTHSRVTPQSTPAYLTNVVSAGGGLTQTNTILRINSDPLEDWLVKHRDTAIHTLIVVGGGGAISAAADQTLIGHIRRLANRSMRVCSVCSGALILAAAGLLDNRRAVTHWEDCGRLAAQYSAVNVEVDPIFIKDGNIWTSAGITAGIDMALAIVAEDLGKPAAMDMARSLVTPMVRSGGQSQFSSELNRQTRDIDGRFSLLHDWMIENIRNEITVDDMARECGMSPRNFSRRYKQVMGLSPAKAVEAARVDVARDLLATSDDSVKSIAVTCGFQDDERMRRTFLRTINLPPSQYRQHFRFR